MAKKTESIKTVSIFCGANEGHHSFFQETAYETGRFFADQNIRLVYGGGKVGMMGHIARGVLDQKGEIVGVIPHFLREKELQHDGLTELVVVDSMHDRKRHIYQISDAFIALPGGFGTLDEIFEIITWGQLGLHQKPVGILNAGGYFNSLIKQMDDMVYHGFLKAELRKMVHSSNLLANLLNQFSNYKAPKTGKWMEPGFQ